MQRHEQAHRKQIYAPPKLSNEKKNILIEENIKMYPRQAGAIVARSKTRTVKSLTSFSFALSIDASCAVVARRLRRR